MSYYSNPYSGDTQACRSLRGFTACNTEIAGLEQAVSWRDVRKYQADFGSNFVGTTTMMMMMMIKIKIIICQFYLLLISMLRVLGMHVKDKVKFALEQAIMVQRRSTGIALLFL